MEFNDLLLILTYPGSTVLLICPCLSCLVKPVTCH